MFIGNRNIHDFPQFISYAILQPGEGAVGKEAVGGVGIPLN